MQPIMRVTAIGLGQLRPKPRLSCQLGWSKHWHIGLLIVSNVKSKQLHWLYQANQSHWSIFQNTYSLFWRRIFVYWDTDISLALGDNNIKRVNNKKSLGFIIDDQLKWGTYIDTQCKKITKNIALLRRAKPYAPLQTLIKMYNALVLPHLTYCSTIWNDGSNTILNKLSKLQRRAARVITGQSYDIRSTEILESIGYQFHYWLISLLSSEKRSPHDIYKVLTNRQPTYMNKISSQLVKIAITP